jgi:hypothetical protein
MRAAVLRSLVGALAVFGVWLATALSAQAATFQNGNGISVVSQSSNGREIDLQVNTTAVQGQHEVIVLLPEGYSANTTTRYPILYLLHGALAGPSRWVNPPGAAPQITDPYPVITVIPDGGVKGWYTDWVNGWQLSPQNWLDFHLGQLVPWIDANLRTIANRSGRAIAGLSMGGFGSLHYAETRPDMFSYAAGADRPSSERAGRLDRSRGGKRSFRVDRRVLRAGRPGLKRSDPGPAGVEADASRPHRRPGGRPLLPRGTSGRCLIDPAKSSSRAHRGPALVGLVKDTDAPDRCLVDGP